MILLEGTPEVSTGETELINATWALFWVSLVLTASTTITVILQVHSDHELVITIRKLVTVITPPYRRANGTVSDETDKPDEAV